MQRIARRLLGSLLVLAAASLVAFTILDVAPGDAAQTLVGESASAEQIQAVREALGLDRSMFLRYLDFLGGAARGDLGKSLINGRPVATLIGERFLHTLVLALTATLLAALLGLASGVFAASRQGRWSDLAIMVAMAFGISAPSFGLAMLLTLAFSLKLRWLPVTGGGSAAHLLLPAVTLAVPLLAVVARLSRSSLLDSAGEVYVLAARARGVPHRQVWRKHILKNALIPVMTLVGLNFGHLLGGAFVVETIFGWPGLGRLIVQAVFDKDYPVILGAVLLLAAIFQLFHLLIDLAHGWLDPRVGSEAV